MGCRGHRGKQDETKSMQVGIQLIVMIIMTDAVNKHKKIKKNRK